MEEKDVPIWERRSAWRSPIALLLILGYIIFGISYGLFWFIKWLLFSWIRPFSDSEWLCKQGFHKYGFVNSSHLSCYKNYKCRVCHKEKEVYVDNDCY